MSFLCKRRVIDFDDVSLGQFCIWLFDFAEEQNDEDFAEIHKFFDWLMDLYFEELNPHYSDRESYVTYEHGQEYYTFLSHEDEYGYPLSPLTCRDSQT